MYCEKIIQEINQKNEYLFRLSICGDESPLHFEIPDILKICSILSTGIAFGQSEIRRLLFLFPRSAESALWLAVCTCLATLKNDFLSAVEKLPPFSKGQKLLLDNKFVVEFDGEEHIDGQRFMWVKYKEQKEVPLSRKIFPIHERLRFQPVSTQKQLSVFKHTPAPSLHPLDQLLKIQSYGNRALFQNRVILVSLLGKARDFATRTPVRVQSKQKNENKIGYALADLFQWGNINADGIMNPWHHHQIKAQPVLAVASDLLSVREYFRERTGSSPLLILDGSSSFFRDLDALDEVLDNPLPSIAIVERGEAETARLLSDRSFGIWDWSRNEIQAIISEENGSHIAHRKSPFFHFNRSLKNYSRMKVEEILCEDPVIQSAADKLEALHMETGGGSQEINLLVSRLYGCLLPVARLIRPVWYTKNTDWKQKIMSRIEKAESGLSRHKMWITSTADQNIRGFLGDIRKIVSDGGSRHSAKAGALREVIPGHGEGPFAIVASDVMERMLVQNYWKENLAGVDRIHFCCPSTLFDNQTDYRKMIICGWLGAKRMRQIMESFMAEEIIILTYPFEKAWLRSVMDRWRDTTTGGLNAETKAKLLRVMPDELPPPDSIEEERDERDKYGRAFDISEFELKLRAYRMAAMAEADHSGEATASAKFAEFSEDRFAFLTESYRIPVITDLFSGRTTESDEIPRKTVSELKPGDYVIFREGSQGDLIREMADQGLEKAGKRHLRRVAGIWRTALKEFASSVIEILLKNQKIIPEEHSPEDATFIVAEVLKQKGCKRHPQTVRNWLTDEDIIGPRSAGDLKTIAEVTGHADLNARFQEIRRAIKEVRGAHLQASRYLAESLISALPGYISSGDSRSLEVDIEGLGKAVVARVEYTEDELREVGITKTNRLLSEEE